MKVLCILNVTAEDSHRSDHQEAVSDWSESWVGPVKMHPECCGFGQYDEAAL